MRLFGLSITNCFQSDESTSKTGSCPHLHSPAANRFTLAGASNRTHLIENNFTEKPLKAKCFQLAGVPEKDALYNQKKAERSLKAKRMLGFTLIEVLVALAILSGALVIVSSSWSGNLLRVRKSNLYNNVALLLESKMSELQAKYYGRPIEEIPESESGDFGSDYKQYRWTFATQKFEMPDLSTVFIKQGEGDQMLLTIIKNTQEYISEAVLEGTLTVYVKGAGDKEVSFTVSTYFVDYNKDLAVGGL